MPSSWFGLPREQLGVAYAGMFVLAVVYYNKCHLIVSEITLTCLRQMTEYSPNTTEGTAFEDSNRNWKEWGIQKTTY